MSWNGVLPGWIYELEYEEYIARLTGAMSEEYHSRFTRAFPKQLIRIYETSKNENRTLGS